MMAHLTPSARVLMLATHGFEEAELFDTRQALLEAGLTVTLASIDKQAIKGVFWDEASGTANESTKSITPDILLAQVNVDHFDALVLPGGVTNPDTLRINADAVNMVRKFVSEEKVVAAICHAPWLLVEANVVKGRRVTGWASVRTDLANAGAHVVDEEVVVDDKPITSRMPANVPAFSQAVIKALTIPTT
jgi:protease I